MEGGREGTALELEVLERSEERGWLAQLHQQQLQQQ